MATASKPKPPSPKKSPVKRAPASPPKPTGPFLRFYHSEALRKKTLSLLDNVENSEDPTAHKGALGDMVVELTNCGLDSYFMKPLKLAKAGFIVQQSANLGLSGAQKVMGSVVRNIIGRMDKPQLLSVCGSIRGMMV